MIRNKKESMQRATFKKRADELCTTFYEMSELAYDINRFLVCRSLEINASIAGENDFQASLALTKKRDQLSGLAYHWRDLSKMLDNCSAAFYEGDEKDGKPEHELSKLAAEYVRWPGRDNLDGLSLVQPLPDTFLSPSKFQSQPFPDETE